MDLYICIAIMAGLIIGSLAYLFLKLRSEPTKEEWDKEHKRCRDLARTNPGTPIESKYGYTITHYRKASDRPVNQGD